LETSSVAMRVYWPKPVMLDGSWGATTGKNGQLKATFYMSIAPGSRALSRHGNLQVGFTLKSGHPHWVQSSSEQP